MRGTEWYCNARRWKIKKGKERRGDLMKGMGKRKNDASIYIIHILLSWVQENCLCSPPQQKVISLPEKRHKGIEREGGGKRERVWEKERKKEKLKEGQIVWNLNRNEHKLFINFLNCLFQSKLLRMMFKNGSSRRHKSWPRLKSPHSRPVR